MINLGPQTELDLQAHRLMSDDELIYVYDLQLKAAEAELTREGLDELEYDDAYSAGFRAGREAS